MKKQKNQEIDRIEKVIKSILKKHNVKKAGIFGSYARGEERKSSDIDILIDVKCSLLGLVRLERELGEKLGNKVDLLTYKSIHPLLKKRILNEEIRII